MEDLSNKKRFMVTGKYGAYTFAIWMISIACSVGYRESEGTAAEYKYQPDARAIDLYSSDTSSIRKVVRKMITAEISPFDLAFYDDDTRIYLDSLVYSPDLKRIIALTIVRTATYKVPYDDSEEPYFYDGFYFYCSRDSLGGPITVYNRAKNGMINFHDYPEISESLRYFCFYRMPEDSTPEFPVYNIDDKRFWTSRAFELAVTKSKKIIENQE